LPPSSYWYSCIPFVVITIWSFTYSWHIAGCITRVTRRMPYVGQELLTWVHLRFLVVFVLLNLFCVVFCRSLFVQLVLVLSVLRCTAFDYTFGRNAWVLFWSFWNNLSSGTSMFVSDLWHVTGFLWLLSWLYWFEKETD
jgi:hypothetical protein